MSEEKALNELVLSLVELFRKFGIKYVLIGGLAVKKYDDYRTTYDVDFLIFPVRRKVDEFTVALLNWARERGLAISTKMNGERLPVSQVTRELVEKVIGEGGRTLEFWREGRKFIDLIFCPSYVSFRTGFYRSVNGINVATPEYLIINKLWLVEKGRAEERDFRDVIRLLSLPDLNKSRLRRYAQKLGVSRLLKEYEHKVQQATKRIRDIMNLSPS